MFFLQIKKPVSMVLLSPLIKYVFMLCFFFVPTVNNNLNDTL